MNDLTRRHFLASVPAAGVGAAATLASSPSPSEAPPQAPMSPLWSLGRPIYATRRRTGQNDPGGLVLKISGLAFARVQKDGTGAQIYFLNAKDAGQQQHFAQLLIHKAGLTHDSAAPDAVTRDLAVYNLKGKVTIDGGKDTMTLTMGDVVRGCDDENAPGLPAGLNSFLQPRSVLGWSEMTYPSAPADELEKRSVAVVYLERGRLEHKDDVAVDDPADVSMLVADGNGKTQVVRQVLYYGLPKSENVTFRIDNRKVTVNSTDNQIIAGLVHMPIHEHLDTSLPSEMKDFAMLKQIVHPPKAVPKVSYAKKCDAGRTPECLCCPVPLELV